MLLRCLSLSILPNIIALLLPVCVVMHVSCVLCWNIHVTEHKRWWAYNFHIRLLLLLSSSLAVIALLYCQNISHNVNKLQQDVLQDIVHLPVAYCVRLRTIGGEKRGFWYIANRIPLAPASRNMKGEEKWEIMCFQWFSRKIWLLLLPAVACSVYSRIKVNRVYLWDTFASILKCMSHWIVYDERWIKVPVVFWVQHFDIIE